MENMAVVQEELKRYCLYLTENQWDAEDLAQEAWIKAFDTLRHSSHSNPQALLLRIAKNAWIDQSRRKKLYAGYIERAKKEFEASVQEFGLGQLEMIFQALMKHMTPLQRAVFLLKDVFDFTIAESAHLLQTTQGAVKAALHRARQSSILIKRELTGNILSMPRDAGYLSILRNLAAAYQVGDIARVLSLAAGDESEAAAVINITHNQILKVIHTRKTVSRTQSVQQRAAA